MLNGTKMSHYKQLSYQCMSFDYCKKKTLQKYMCTLKKVKWYYTVQKKHFIWSTFEWQTKETRFLPTNQPNLAPLVTMYCDSKRSGQSSRTVVFLKSKPRGVHQPGWKHHMRDWLTASLTEVPMHTNEEHGNGEREITQYQGESNQMGGISKKAKKGEF